MQNVLRRAAVLHEGPQLPISAFPLAVQHALGSMRLPSTHALASVSSIDADHDTLHLTQALKGLTLVQIERIVIENAIDLSGGSVPAAARVLDVSPSTIYRKRERWEAGKIPESSQ